MIARLGNLPLLTLGAACAVLVALLALYAHRHQRLQSRGVLLAILGLAALLVASAFLIPSYAIIA